MTTYFHNRAMAFWSSTLYTCIYQRNSTATREGTQIHIRLCMKLNRLFYFPEQSKPGNHSLGVDTLYMPASNEVL